MKPTFIILLLLFIMRNNCTSQTILPSNYDEFCPSLETQFYLSLPHDCSSIALSDPDNNGMTISSPTSIYASSTVTTFYCTITFGDKNVTQKLRVNYHDNNTNTDMSYDFSFAYIRSLLIPSSQNTISPNYSSLSAPLCETPSFNINFQNIQYVNISTGTKFNTITTYEYSLPQGWTLGSTTSTGPSNWITASNSVTITADKTNGATDSYIKIRAVNNCGGNLYKGQEVSIPIIRNEPQLTFTPGIGFICGTSAQLTASNVPSWITGYQWQITPGAAFSLSSTTTNPITLTRGGNTEATINLTISSNTCPLTFTYNTQKITGQDKIVGGTPLVNTNLMIYNSPGDDNELCRFTEYYIPFTTGYSSSPNWTYVSSVGSPQPSWAGGTSDISVYFFRNQQQSLLLNMSATNLCGTSSYNFNFKAIDCPVLFASNNYNYSVFPNPSKGQIHVALKPSAQMLTSDQKSVNNHKISQIIVYNSQNVVLFTQKYNNVSGIDLDLGKLPKGTYIMSIISGKIRETQQVIIK